MINLFYHVKLVIFGNGSVTLGRRTLATFERKEDAVKFRDVYWEALSGAVKNWTWIVVYGDYGQKRMIDD